MPRDVLITGGSGGIGQELARRCVEIGDRVVVTGRDEGRLVASVERSGARPVVCDPTRPEEVEALVRQVGGSVDVLVNMSGGNADFDRQGVDHPRLDDVADAWRTNLDTNLLSTVLVTTAVLGDMRPGGAVVNVGSIGAEYASTSYGVAKAAVQAWTAGLSREVGPRGITVNSVSPGYIEDTGYFKGRLTPQRHAALVNATHDKRAGLPADVAETVLFLASAGARHITGQTVHVNGGAFTTR